MMSRRSRRRGPARRRERAAGRLGLAVVFAVTLRSGVAGDVAGRGLSFTQPAILRLNALVDLLAMDLHARRRVDTQFHVVSLHLDDRDFHVVPDPDVLAEIAGQEEHRALDFSSILLGFRSSLGEGDERFTGERATLLPSRSVIGRAEAHLNGESGGICSCAGEKVAAGSSHGLVMQRPRW